MSGNETKRDGADNRADAGSDRAVMSYLEPIDNERYLTNKFGRTPERIRDKLRRIREALYDGSAY